MISMALAVGVILVVCTLRYGATGLMHVAHYPLHASWVVYLAIVLQCMVVAGAPHTLLWTVGSALCVGAFGIANRRCWGILIASAGALLNFSVMSAAGGRMPVHTDVVTRLVGDTLANGTILQGTKSVVGLPAWPALQVLSDQFVLFSVTGHLVAWSIGDIVLLGGVLALFWSLMKGSPHA